MNLRSLVQRIIKRLTGREPALLRILPAGALAMAQLAVWRRYWRWVARRASRRAVPRDGTTKLALVIPWFGREAAGGAEAEAYGLIQALRTHAPHVQVEVFTTTLKEFAADWNTPYHAEGTQTEDGITVHRFHPERPHRDAFHYLNGTYLMRGGTDTLWDDQHRRRSPLHPFAEAYFLQRMVLSKRLLKQLATQLHTFDGVLLMPYLFATTVLGAWIAGHKALLIPCLHDERYAFMDVFAHAFQHVGTILCHVRSEADLCTRLYPDAPRPFLLGEQVDTDVAVGDARRFREKYDLHDPFILYAGRQVEGKNVPLLVEWFTHLRNCLPEGERLQLVLIGKGDLDYRDVPGVHALGFIPLQDKIDAYRAALCLGLLSVNESFSIVLMEAWLQSTPALVHAGCAVTRDHIEDSGGGFAVVDADAFAQAVRTLLDHPDSTQAMGEKGRAYVLANYRAEQIVQRFLTALHAARPAHQP
jgi:glycosyltransferase involved in cell wall biosynthesis